MVLTLFRRWRHAFAAALLAVAVGAWALPGAARGDALMGDVGGILNGHLLIHVLPVAPVSILDLHAFIPGHQPDAFLVPGRRYDLRSLVSQSSTVLVLRPEVGHLAVIFVPRDGLVLGGLPGQRLFGDQRLFGGSGLVLPAGQRLGLRLTSPVSPMGLVRWH